MRCLSLTWLFAIVLEATSLSAVGSDQARMLKHLDAIEATFEQMYAPAELKGQLFSWNLQAEMDAARAAVASAPQITVAGYQGVCNHFLKTCKDYHVSFRLACKEVAHIPLSVCCVGGQFLITAVERADLPYSYFPVDIGDELVRFGGQPIRQVMDHLIEWEIGAKYQPTDMATACGILMQRSASSGHTLPHGRVELEVRKANGQVVVRQLEWRRTHEVVQKRTSDWEWSDSSDSLAFSGVDLPCVSYDNPARPGSRKGFIPPLGRVLWQTADDCPFYAYIAQNASGKRIAYVRIATYTPKAADTQYAFFGLMERFQNEADVLVVDQTNNAGGFLSYGYSLLSSFISKPVRTTKEDVRLNSETVQRSMNMLKLLEPIKTDAEARIALRNDLWGYEATMATVADLLKYHRKVLDAWNSGETIVYDLPSDGLSKVYPRSHGFKKPVVCLINEQDFSTADFIPAILQDNKAAMLVGTRTAGAGGFVIPWKASNPFGIETINLTGSVASRLSGQVIENVGVAPDVWLEVLPDDIRNGYRGYIASVNRCVDQLI